MMKSSSKNEYYGVYTGSVFGQKHGTSCFCLITGHLNWCVKLLFPYPVLYFLPILQKAQTSHPFPKNMRGALYPAHRWHIFSSCGAGDECSIHFGWEHAVLCRTKSVYGLAAATFSQQRWCFGSCILTKHSSHSQYCN